MTKIYEVTLHYAKWIIAGGYNKKISMGFYSTIEIAFKVKEAIETKANQWEKGTTELGFRYVDITAHFVDARSDDLEDDFFDLSKWHKV